MGSSSGGKKKYVNYRNRQRAQMSFFIVVIFFAIFGLIVFAEIFLIDERGRGAGVLVRHGSLVYHSRQQEINEYEESLQNDDYISIRLGSDLGSLDNSIGALLLGRNQAPIPVGVDDAEIQSSKDILENNHSFYPTHLSPSKGSWQIVNGTRYKFFVFSAFYDRRKLQRSIRIIAATKTRGPDKVSCKFWYKSADDNPANFTSKWVPAKIRVIRENWNLKYSACFVMCPLAHNQTAPNFVSVVVRKNSMPTNLLEVTDNYNETKTVKKFAVCVKPLHFSYNRALQILEFIELNRIMGVEHFTFYNHTIGPQVNCLLKDYIEQGLVTMLPWQLDMISQKEIRTEGLFAALNDCLYRSMYRYSHVSLIDLDEYIVPRHNDTLPQLIDFLNRRMNTRTTGSYSFQNAFFYLQWGDDDSVYNSNDPIATNLVILKKTRRRSKLHPHKQRSKYICRPELVVEAGNHFVWEFLPGHGTLNVPPDAAILHHYRVCEFGGNDCIKTPSTVDTTAFRYRDRLVGRVSVSWEKNKNKCELDDPPLPPSRVFSKIMKILKSSEER
ncbi:beta-1,4-galactosyltransferase galt-1 [Harmonia axyridis]|uniref:beta-1,4-galactosyltransferase galt-1 n=1 Tax=Harmonia axyridis TaxID=115357 RepID=UPI001E276628|nr:beta-1,4-galactosyltransferase galt-1 [Harmonia axyridis]XP_045478106.1 beta-1,4-galactosyltransferase galt-1 [Harmonia axyridis]XP_045478107.1 beta-1,4-galactosyltransferase galt-1 [Harmonia axyridis]XP_045478108.1 beta-1,4-galactosyltransferase galt-1 [Harmonia axyridis]XP_045478109.1 beta-1,4-galactosyltransferase galt-1 [Harmonia axyridis]